MPWAHGTYFTENDEKQARDFLKSQGLTDDQVEGVNHWHRSHIGGQLALWVGVAMIIGAVIGFTLGQV